MAPENQWNSRKVSNMNKETNTYIQGVVERSTSIQEQISNVSFAGPVAAAISGSGSIKTDSEGNTEATGSVSIGDKTKEGLEWKVKGSGSVKINKEGKPQTEASVEAEITGKF